MKLQTGLEKYGSPVLNKFVILDMALTAVWMVHTVE